MSLGTFRNKDTLHCALLGCGRISKRYVEVFQNEIQGAQVAVACDKVAEKAESVAKSLQCKASTDYDSVLKDPSINTVIILTESGNHDQHSRKALEAGKHVIVEKPSALHPKQILANGALAKKNRLMYAPILQNRFNPAMKALKSAVESGRFGKLVLGSVKLIWCRGQDYYSDGWHGTWKLDGGVISQQALHHLDALEWVCGGIQEVISAQANRVNRLEAEDTTVAAVKFKSGALGTIEATTAARPEDFEASISIIGETGTAIIDGIALNHIRTWKFVKPEAQDAKIPTLHSQEVPNGYGLSHGPLLQEIVDRIRSGELNPPISAEEAAKPVQLVHALYQSAETGTWVTLDSQPASTRLAR